MSEHRILVGVDGSEGSLRALRWAVEEAKRRGATVIALHAWHEPVMVGPMGVPMPAPEPGALKRAAGTVLDAAVGGLGSSDGVTIEQRLVEARAAEALISNAADADLIVVGSRGRGGFAGLLLGSVSQQVAHHARTPVVIVPPANDAS